MRWMCPLVKCAEEFCTSLTLLFRHDVQEIFSICSFLFMGIILRLWHQALLLGALPLMLNHVDIKVFLWLTRHDMSGNIQPGSKMELVKGLHTTTNAQTEQGMKRKKTCLVTQTSIETGTKTVLCRVLNEALLSFQFIVWKLCLLEIMTFKRRREQWEGRWKMNPPNKPLFFCSSSDFRATPWFLWVR